MRAITLSATARVLLTAGVLAAALAGAFAASPASAQSSASYPYCLMTDDAQKLLLYVDGAMHGVAARQCRFLRAEQHLRTGEARLTGQADQTSTG